jgi:hypothetical protein
VRAGYTLPDGGAVLSTRSADDYEVNGWAVSIAFITGALLVASGMIAFMYGASALLFGSGTEQATGVLFHVGSKAWGATHATAGILLFAAGLNMFSGNKWSRIVGLGISIIVLLAGIASLAESPVFGTFLILLNLFIIWALWFHWRSVKEVTA